MPSAFGSAAPTRSPTWRATASACSMRSASRSAHVCGASMGGMIAQHVAASAPERVKSLTLMMTSSGARRLPGPTLKVRSAMISRPPDPQTVPNIVEHYVRLYALIGSPAYPSAPDYLRERFTTSILRSYRPAGTARQMVAIGADGDRSPLLAAHSRADADHPRRRRSARAGAAGADLKREDRRRRDRRHRRHGPRPAGSALAALRGRHRPRGGARLSIASARSARRRAVPSVAAGRCAAASTVPNA